VKIVTTEGATSPITRGASKAACADASAEKYRPQFEALFSKIAALREGKPTILRTINRYNDWIGWDEANLGPEEDRTTKVILDRWDAMLCAAAEENAFGCADIYRAFNGPDGLEPSGDLLGAGLHPSVGQGQRVDRRDLGWSGVRATCVTNELVLEVSLHLEQ
jgi:hypothetical protein